MIKGANMSQVARRGWHSFIGDNVREQGIRCSLDLFPPGCVPFPAYLQATHSHSLFLSGSLYLSSHSLPWMFFHLDHSLRNEGSINTGNFIKNQHAWIVPLSMSPSLQTPKNVHVCLTDKLYQRKRTCQKNYLFVPLFGGTQGFRSNIVWTKPYDETTL